MRAELTKAKEKVAFVWGADCDIADGLVCVQRYTFNVPCVIGKTHTSTITTESARDYWAGLLRVGFHRKTPKVTELTP